MQTGSDSIRFLQDYIDTHIPLTGDMGIRVAAWDDEGLMLTAPFAPNRNDKGTAFGGSLSVMVTLAGWGLTALFLHDAGIRADVMVRRTRIDYERPVHGTLITRCMMPDESERRRFRAALRHDRKARWDLRLEVAGNGAPAVISEGSFVAVLSSPR